MTTRKKIYLYERKYNFKLLKERLQRKGQGVRMIIKLKKAACLIYKHIALKRLVLVKMSLYHTDTRSFFHNNRG
jgi:hypothetical protein